VGSSAAGALDNRAAESGELRHHQLGRELAKHCDKLRVTTEQLPISRDIVRRRPPTAN
jgi:hypothetical protein